MQGTFGNPAFTARKVSRAVSRESFTGVMMSRPFMRGNVMKEVEKFWKSPLQNVFGARAKVVFSREREKQSVQSV